MTIDIICPLYNAENYVVKQLKQIEMQSYYNYVKNIRYVITKGQDNTADTIRKQQKENNKIIYKEIEPKDFSHSLTREKEAFESNADIVVFITQDVIIEEKDWLEKLVNPIENNECEACYSRQICDNNTIEKYTRECNYPAESKIVSKDDIEKLGLKPGTVSIFGLLNNKDHDINIYIDKEIMNEKLITFNPNDNTATIFITLEDMLKIFDDLDYNYEVIEL